MNFQDSADWTYPVPIHYGPGRISELPEIFKKNNLKRPLIVTDIGSSDLPFIKGIINNLDKKGIFGELFDEISPNPLDIDILKGKSIYEEGKHDSIIAIGGGSGMDGGKAISLMAGNKHNIWDFNYDNPVDEKLNNFPPLLCIPTTAGTGAETESTSMITNTFSGMKLCIWHPNQKPIGAILDPNLTLSLPRNLTSWTGVDALVHAIEAYSVNSLNSVADGMALEALRLIGENLQKVVKKPNDIEARGAMLVGSCLAGISFLKGLGLVHAISHMIGAVYNTQHGLTNAILLPSILKFNQFEIDHKINNMHFAMFSKPGKFNDFYKNISNILEELEIPSSLKEIGVQADKINELAVKSSKDSAAYTNPKQASIDDLEKIIKNALVEAR